MIGFAEQEPVEMAIEKNNLCEYTVALAAAIFLQNIIEDPVNHINLLKLDS